MSVIDLKHRNIEMMMTKRIFRSVLFATTIVFLANLMIITGCLYNYYQNIQEKQLQNELRLASYAVESEGITYLEKLSNHFFQSTKSIQSTQSTDYRFTWIDSDGIVLFDTSMAANQMENHKDRIEIQEALVKGQSSCIRFSNTLMEQTLYHAKRLNDGTILRISIRQATVFALVIEMLKPTLFIAVFAVILSAILAHWMARKIVHPLNRLDLDRPLENNTYEELAPLLSRIHQQHQQIRKQLRSLQEKTDEFTQITSHMNEGLILLDNQTKILSMNPAAQKIFQLDREQNQEHFISCVGQEFLQIDRSPDVNHAVLFAVKHGHSEIRTKRNGREYQFDVSRIESDGMIIGTVLLAFDVTEQTTAERSRREFTANVSHELKTPLQSIMGSAELLENGLVKQEDVPHFIHLIRTESARLVTLVEDIIHLAQLDENDENKDLIPAFESVNLYEIANDVVSALQSNAVAKNIQIVIRGEPIMIKGIQGFLYEMLYNLCDNAIKYNIENGRVEVCVLKQDTGPVISVKDTGIGIPSEYQSRIFERFFRVDKSRSKASGGTGLGLSIVKHIAQYHHASVKLYSQVGKGTQISIIF